MNSRFFLSSVILLSLFPGLFAQKGVIEGAVIDANGPVPMEYAQIGLYGLSDSAFVDGTISGPDGSFRIDRIRSGTYYLEISFIGYKTEIIRPELEQILNLLTEMSSASVFTGEKR